MFDEKKPIWIKIYKFFVIASAIIILLGGCIWAKEEATWYSYGVHFSFGEFLVYALMFAAVAAVELTSGMLVVNFLNNVQLIREKLEEKE